MNSLIGNELKISQFREMKCRKKRPTIASTMTTRPDTQSASLNPSSRLRARLGLQVKRMLGGPCGRRKG